MGGAPLPHPAPAPTLQLRGRQGPALSRPRWPCHALLRRHPHRTHDPLRGDSFMLPLGWQIHVATTPPAPLGRASVSAPERRTRQVLLEKAYHLPKLLSSRTLRGFDIYKLPHNPKSVSLRVCAK